MYVHFDASTITPDDYDPVTLNLIRATNLANHAANNAAFTMWGEPKFEHNALSTRAGNMHCDLPGALQILFPEDFHYSIFVVFAVNSEATIQSSNFPVLCQTQHKYGTGYANMLTITGYNMSGLQLKVNRSMSMSELTNPNLDFTSTGGEVYCFCRL